MVIVKPPENLFDIDAQILEINLGGLNHQK